MIAQSPIAYQSAHRITLRDESGVSYRRALRQEVTDALQAGMRRIMVDCAEWAQLDLILLSSLITCAADCNRLGAEFSVVNLSPELQARIEHLHVAPRIGLA